MGATRSRWVRPAGVTAVLILFAVELVAGWSALVAAMQHLSTPRVGWLTLVVLAQLGSMSVYARMQRRLLRSAGVRSSHRDNLRLTYAAHALNETLPGGPAFSTRLNFRHLRRFGAGPAVASWVIALSGLLSAAALAAITAGGALTSGGDTPWPRLVALIGVGVLVAFGLRHVTAHPDAAQAMIRRPLAAVNRLRRKPRDSGQEGVAVFLSQLRTARLRPVDGLAAAVFAVLNWLLDAAALWLSFYAVGGSPPSPTAVLLAFCAAMAAGSVTLVPGGLGIIDGALVVGLVMSGAPTSVAIAAIVLYRIVSFGFIIGLGWIVWLRLRRAPAAPPAQERRGGPRTALHRLHVCPRSRPAASFVERRRPPAEGLLESPRR